MAQLICRNVAVGYGSKVVLHNIDFEVHAGNYICIAGENGSGKTTLMKTILGLQKPLKGEIHLGDGLHANEIGYLPQQTVLQKDFPASVLEIVLSGFQGTCGIRPFYTRKEKKRAQKALQEVGMGRFSRNCYRELSGGQQQRVLLARALCATKKNDGAGRTGFRAGSQGISRYVSNDLSSESPIRHHDPYDLSRSGSYEKVCNTHSASWYPLYPCRENGR